MVEYIKLILSTLFLLAVFKNVDASCYYYYNGYTYIRYCYNNPYLIILGASYGAVIGLGILVSFIVCCCCIQKKNRQWTQGTLIVQTVPGTNNPLTYPSENQQIQHPAIAGTQGIQTPHIMMAQTHYGGSQGQHSTSVNFQTNPGTGANPSGTVQQGNE
ncbi:uncharacterized protein LOC133194419 [Saccostrea echinata]|uniref:uncharacterized protein LOC133194419 n=1 Tax=Saccostrea echinata TaxID=191078 RepID=UPI002A802B6C|nr:uncharacterized protein LOC133194419 [Saccostrea echinata]